MLITLPSVELIMLIVDVSPDKTVYAKLQLV